MADQKLTLRDLNRATLARQMLLERRDVSIPDAIDHLVGLQAQAASAPFVGLWTRLPDLQRADLAELLDARKVVKAAWVRGTLHLVSAGEYRRLRPTLQPMLTGGYDDIVKRRGPGIDVGAVVAAARDHFAEEPRTFAELSAWLPEQFPGEDVGSLRHAVRMHLPIVQVPVAKGWSYPAKPQFALADDWLGKPVATDDSGDGLEELLRRYLAAFGPASVTDMQAWSGFKGLKEVVEGLRSSLVTYRDEQRNELFDLPDAERPDADTAAPPRFLPEYDNLLLSHRKRTRVVADEHRKQVYLPGLRVAATVLVDGVVAGTWAVDKAKREAGLVIRPFGRLAKDDRAALVDEGERLVRFVEPDAKAHEVRVEPYS